MYRARVSTASYDLNEPQWYFSGNGFHWIPSTEMPTLDNWFEITGQSEHSLARPWRTEELLLRNAAIESMTELGY